MGAGGNTGEGAVVGVMGDEVGSGTVPVGISTVGVGRVGTGPVSGRGAGARDGVTEGRGPGVVGLQAVAPITNKKKQQAIRIRSGFGIMISSFLLSPDLPAVRGLEGYRFLKQLYR